MTQNKCSIKIPEKKFSKVRFIGHLNCYNINNIILPSKLKLIGLDAFLNCYRLIEVYNLSSIKLENNKENGCVSYYSVIINTNIDSKSIIFKDELGFYYYIINNEYY